MELSNIQDCKDINAKLLSLYGKHVVVDKPNYRLVFAPEQFEKRFGTFDVFVGDVFLRSEGPMVKEIPKYSYLGNQWIVERLIENHFRDVMEGGYTYECIYAFPEGTFPSWKAVEFLIAHLFGRIKGQDRLENRNPRNQVEAEYKEAERIAREKKATRERLDDECISDIGIALRSGEAVSFANSKNLKEEKDEVNNRIDPAV